MNTDTEYYNLSDLAVTLNGIVRRLERMEQAITDLSQNFTPKTVQNENFKEYSVRNIETGLGGDIGGGLRRGYKGETLGGGKKGGKGFENAPGEVSTKVVQKANEIMAAYLSGIEAERIKKPSGQRNAANEVENLLKMGYTERQILQAVKDAANDPFWRKQFRSLLKLRRKNKDGVLYIDVFLALNQTAHKLPTNRPKIIV